MTYNEFLEVLPEGWTLYESGDDGTWGLVDPVDSTICIPSEDELDSMPSEWQEELVDRINDKILAIVEEKE